MIDNRQYSAQSFRGRRGNNSKTRLCKGKDSVEIEHFIQRLTEGSRFDFGTEMKVVEEKKLTEKDKKDNLILIGYPNKNSIMKEMAPSLPIKNRYRYHKYQWNIY